MTEVLEHLSDEALTADLDSEWRGPRREAEILLPIPAEARLLVARSARRATNMIGGRFSDQLAAEAARYLRGTLTEESDLAMRKDLGPQYGYNIKEDE